MLQKLPKTPGDSVTLGVIVAVGSTIVPKRNNRVWFASFNNDGDIISYEVDAELFSELVSLLSDQSDSDFIDNHIIRFKKTKEGFEISDKDGDQLAIRVYH